MSRRLVTRIRRHLHTSRALQLGLISLFWLAGNGIAQALALPIPGPVIGLGLALAALASGWLRTESLRGGARLLIGDMLLFFIPAVLAILDHREFIGLLGLKILAVILVGTLTVMAATALAVDLGFRLMLARGARHGLAS